MSNQESLNIGVDEIYLSVENFIKDRIEKIGFLINSTDKKITAYDKFLVLPQLIEFLGACLDEYDFDTEGKSKNRFNEILKNYIGNKYKYKSFLNVSSTINLYRDFRCGLIHQLRPLNGIGLTTKQEAEEDGNEHMKTNPEGFLVIVLEELFSDIKKGSDGVLQKIKEELNNHNCSEFYKNKMSKSYIVLVKYEN